jgi:methylglutaconyl-CoA hydratase
VSDSAILCALRGGVAHITLNRAEKRNALDRATITALTSELMRCASDPAVRVVQISGAGQVFCAGADLAEMQAQAHASEADNVEHARHLATLLGILYSLSKPTVARINGDGYGGALGLIAACDIAIVAADAKFAFTEVRLGIIPAVVSPFVLAKIGEHAALRYFLTAETMTASTLKDIGLAHEVVKAGELDAACEAITSALLKGAPGAQAEAKALIRERVGSTPHDRTAGSLQMAVRLAKIRVQPEAQEGFAAFFAKRKPAWRSE